MKPAPWHGWQTLRREIVDHEIARHAGRLFKETGDGFLVEFASAVQAVTCAMEIQKQVEAKAGEGSTAAAAHRHPCR